MPNEGQYIYVYGTKGSVGRRAILMGTLRRSTAAFLAEAQRGAEIAGFLVLLGHKRNKLMSNCFAPIPTPFDK